MLVYNFRIYKSKFQNQEWNSYIQSTNRHGALTLCQPLWWDLKNKRAKKINLVLVHMSLNIWLKYKKLYRCLHSSILRAIMGKQKMLPKSIEETRPRLRCSENILWKKRHLSSGLQIEWELVKTFSAILFNLEYVSSSPLPSLYCSVAINMFHI